MRQWLTDTSRTSNCGIACRMCTIKFRSVGLDTCFGKATLAECCRRDLTRSLHHRCSKHLLRGRCRSRGYKLDFCTDRQTDNLCPGSTLVSEQSRPCSKLASFYLQFGMCYCISSNCQLIFLSPKGFQRPKSTRLKAGRRDNMWLKRLWSGTGHPRVVWWARCRRGCNKPQGRVRKGCCRQGWGK